MDNKPFAEIIESSLTTWSAQCWYWDHVPNFGSLVTLEQGDKVFFGLVYDIKTGSIDNQRYPFPYQKTEAELRKEQPQIFELLKTTFSCLSIGVCSNKKMSYQVSAQPPKIHAFVARASEVMQKKFFAQDLYLHVLFGSKEITCVDELLLAILQQCVTLKLLTAEKMNHVIQLYSLLTGNDYRRLKLFLQRVQAIVPPLE